jgi:hypothetical protein
MFSRKADGSLTVQIPGPAEDRPSWTRVGVITAIGFIVGVAWPKLAGVRLGPSVPEASPSVASAAPPASEAPGAAPAAAPMGAPATAAAVPAVAASPAPAPAASAPAPVTVTVGHGVVFGCRTSDGESLKGGDCGSLPGLDSLVMPHLRKLAECPEASGVSGKVHFVVHLDFPRGGVGVDLGRGHAVPAPDALLACAKADVAGLGLSAVAHENPRYSVSYTVTFGGGAGAPGTSASAPARTGGEAADGSAQVVWEVAIVRDAPKTGKVVGRLQRGAELHLGAAKDGWYPVKFGDGFASEGWIYRGAIGR